MRIGFWVLDHADGPSVKQGDTLVDFRGDIATLLGGTPPHKPSSTGRVYVQLPSGSRQEFFPSVFNLKWNRASSHV